MKKEDWEKAKSRLRAPLGQVDLLCDGYSVTLVNECISMFRNSLSIMDFQHLYYDALQAALRLGEQIGQAYRLCDASAWDADELAVTWGNGVLYDADQEWTERKELVQMGLLKPELALAWKFDLPAETEADLAEIRKNYMPELKDLEG